MGEQVENLLEEKKQEEEAVKGDEKKPEESKDSAPAPEPAPVPPPPPEIVLRVFMHCEGCARKVRRCLRGFDGVEDIQTDCKTHKVVVKGEKAEPLKVLERVQKKSHRQVELLSPVPKPPADEPKVKEKEPPKPEEKKEEPPQVINVVLKVNMHCDACAQVIRKRILRMKGVESAETDLKNSQVNVKGTFDPLQLVEYIHKRIGKQAIVIKQDPEPKKEEEKKDSGEEKNSGDDGAGTGAGATTAAGDGKESKKEKKEEEKKTGDGGGEDSGGGPVTCGDGGDGGGEEMTVVDVRKNEYNYYHNVQLSYQLYPWRYTAETAYGYPPAPQMFSDENPNACFIM